MAILKYIGRRLLVLIPVLLGISLAAFLLGRIAPGDPVDDALFRIGIEFPTEEDRADMRAELGLDRPLPVQYLDWLGDALRGDLGRSYIGNKDIAQELMTRLPITLKVSLAAMLAAVVFGPGAGFAVGAVADIIGGVLAGYAINPLITLGAGAIGLVAGFAWQKLSSLSTNLRLAASVLLGHFVGSMVITSLALRLFYGYPWATLAVRIPNALILSAVNIVLLRILLENRSLMKLAKK